MISAFILVACGVVAGTWGASTLAGAPWATSAPRLALVAWQALALSILMSITAAGAALSISFQHLRGDLAGLLDLCAQNLKHGYASPGGALAGTLGVTTVAVLITRTAWCAFRISRQESSERRARVVMLDLVGRADIIPGVLVLPHDAPYAFCIGGRQRRVVVTSSLLDSLDRLELDAVLAHESAHLRQRHHVVLTICRTMFAVLAPFFPAFRAAMPHVRLLAELSADDCARKRVGARPLYSALLRLACLPVPAGGLAASASDVETRLVRLARGASGLGRRRAIGTGITIAALVVVPLVLAVAPAVALAWEGICLIG